jgi:NADPH2 dehydrogenase
MRMDDPIPQFSEIIKKLSPLKLAYFHLVESRIAGNADVESFDKLGFAMDLWDGPLLIAVGFRSDSARKLVDEEEKNRNVVVMFGRLFIFTPDLPFRIKAGMELNQYNRDTFYTPKDPIGYIDFAFSSEYLKTTAPSASRIGNLFSCFHFCKVWL